MTFREALSRRLDILKPTRQQVEEFARKEALQLTPGMRYRRHYTHIKLFLLFRYFYLNRVYERLSVYKTILGIWTFQPGILKVTGKSSASVSRDQNFHSQSLKLQLVLLVDLCDSSGPVNACVCCWPCAESR